MGAALRIVPQIEDEKVLKHVVDMVPLLSRVADTRFEVGEIIKESDILEVINPKLSGRNT